MRTITATIATVSRKCLPGKITTTSLISHRCLPATKTNTSISYNLRQKIVCADTPQKGTPQTASKTSLKGRRPSSDTSWTIRTREVMWLARSMRVCATVSPKSPRFSLTSHSSRCRNFSKKISSIRRSINKHSMRSTRPSSKESSWITRSFNLSVRYLTATVATTF